MPLLSHHATVSARTPLAFNSAARAARSVLTGAPSDGWTEVRSGEGTRAAQYAHAADTAGRIAIYGGAVTLRELVAELVAIDSVNPRLVPGCAGELEIARFIAGWL